MNLPCVCACVRVCVSVLTCLGLLREWDGVCVCVCVSVLTCLGLLREWDGVWFVGLPRPPSPQGGRGCSPICGHQLSRQQSGEGPAVGSEGEGPAVGSEGEGPAVGSEGEGPAVGSEGERPVVKV